MRYHFFLLLFAFTASGQAQQIDSVKLYSEHLQAERLLRIWTPPGYQDSAPHTVIYTFDADWLFDLAWPMANYYGPVGMGMWPNTMVVGIHFEERNADMDVQWDKGTLGPQGLRFKDYVKQEVIPYVESHYKTASFRTIVGHSNSATYLNFFLWDSIPLFNGYVALSQYALPGDSLRMEEVAQSKLDMPLYYALGSAGHDDPFRLASGKRYNRWFEHWGSQSAISFQHFLMEQADHGTVASQAMPQALESIFQDASIIPGDFEEVAAAVAARKVDAMAFIDSCALALNERFGLQAAWQENEYFFAYEVHASRQDVAGIRAVTKRYQKHFPEDKSMIFIEAQCLEQAKAYKEAEISYLANLNLNPEAGYWSHLRLLRLYEKHLNLPEKAFEIAELGWQNLEDARFLYQAGKMAAKYKVRMTEGAAFLEAYLQSEPSGSMPEPEWAYYRLGQIAQHLAQIDQAREHWAMSLSLAPDFQEVQEALDALP